ncbi:forkhead box protein J1.2-like [Rhinophrynus dorsalis]
MPVLSSTLQLPNPAERERVRDDDSLTNLQWLQDFSILSTDLSSIANTRPPQPRASQGPCSPPAGDTASCQAPRLGKPRSVSGIHVWPSLPTASPSTMQEVDYRTNANVKPPYSYASLICMAMEASQQRKLTLSAIYSWITQNFCYYRHADPSWQNSIRHNLSLNKCFMKVPRGKDEPGKGGFWQMDPRYADMFVNGVLKKKRMSSPHLDPPRCNRTATHHPYQTAAHPRNHHLQQISGRNKHSCRYEKPSPVLPALRVPERHGDTLFAPEDHLHGSNFDDLDLQTALISLWWEGDQGSSGLNSSSGLDTTQQDPPMMDNHWYMPPDQQQSWEEVKEETVIEQWCSETGYVEDVLYECPPWEHAETLL